MSSASFRTGFRQLFQVDGYISLSTRGLPPDSYKITRMVLDPDKDDFDAADPWTTWHSLPTHRSGFLGELTRSAWPVLIHNLRLTNDPILGDRLKDFGSVMAVPLFDAGEPLNWSLSLRKDAEGFSIEDLEDAVLRANLVGGQVRNVLIAKQLREAAERIQHEVNRIASIQRSLLPDQMPDVPGVSLAASYETFDRAGGDMYAFRQIGSRPLQQDISPDQPWAVMMADASGHGPSAAVVMAMLHAIMHAYPKSPKGAAEVLAHANEHLYAKRIEDSFVTAFFAIYDPSSRKLTYSSAGHPPPIVKNAGPGGEVFRLDNAGGLPLGIVPDAEFEDASLILRPDQTLVLYTDGITEAMNPGRRMFGVEGIEQALVDCTGEPECVVSSIKESLRLHEAGIRPTDDQTILAMKILQ